MGAEKSASTNERCGYQPRRLNTRMITRLFVKFVCKVFPHARWEAGLKSGCGNLSRSQGGEMVKELNEWANAFRNLQEQALAAPRLLVFDA